MAEKINLVFFNFDGSIPLVTELNRYYQNSPKFAVENIETANEVNQLLSTTSNGILFFKVQNKQDLQNAVAILKTQKKLIKKGLVKPACIMGLKNKKVDAVLAKYGCVDILEPDTRGKTVSFKLDFWSKPILQHLAKIEQEEKIKMSRQENADKDKDKNKKKEEFVFTKALDLESDIWIIKTKSDYKKVLRRWLIRAIGPSTFVGKWVELQPQPGDKLPTWKFVLNDPNNKDYIKNDGAWFFYGSKPEFDWKLNRWSFSSDYPHLYFYDSDGKVFSRFKFDHDHVQIAENSDFANAREEMILATCDTQYNFEHDQEEKGEDKSLEGEDAVEESIAAKLDSDKEAETGNLEGKVHDGAEELGGNMSGKTEGGADNIDGHMSGELRNDQFDGASNDENRKAVLDEEPMPGTMSGKSSTDQIDNGPLSGKSSTDQINNDPLSGELKPGEEVPSGEKKPASFQEEPISGHMGGKSSTDQINNDPLSGELKPGEEVPSGEKKPASFQEEPIPGHMGGKSSTDQINNDPLSGELKPGEEAPSGEKKPASFQEEPIPGHMGGKASTDQINNDPLSGELKPGEEVPSGEKKPASFQEEPIPGHMGGKASTDQMNNDPLSGELKPGEEAPSGEKKPASFQEEPIPGHMGGKSSTDQMNNDPLSGELKPNENSAGQGAEKPAHPNQEILNENPMDGFGDQEHPGDDIGKSSRTTMNNGVQDGQSGARSSAEHGNVKGNLDGFAEDDFSESGLPSVEQGLPSASVDEEAYGADAFSDVQVPTNENIITDLDELGKTTGRPATLNNVDGVGHHQDPLKPQAQEEQKSRYDRDNEEVERRADMSQYEVMEGFADAKAEEEQQDPSQQGIQAPQVQKEQAATQSSERNQEPVAATKTPAATSNSAFGATGPASRSEKEDEMEDALGGGLTQGAKKPQRKNSIIQGEIFNTVIDGNKEEQAEDLDLDEIIGNAPKDLNLESGVLKVTLKQMTAAGNDINFMCDFQDFYEDELSVLAPQNSLAVGTDVIANVGLLYGGKRVKVKCEGVIEEIEADDGRDLLVINIKKIDKSQYETFMTLYQERQGSITDFMTRARGYGE